jgi:hypothetical protein
MRYFIGAHHLHYFLAVVAVGVVGLIELLLDFALVVENFVVAVAD